MQRQLAISVACAALAALAAGGCANLLGIEDLSEGGGDPDARIDGPVIDAGTDAAVDAPPSGPVKIGFPDQFADRAELTSGFVWAIDVRVTQLVTVDQLGLITIDGAGVPAHVGLYTGTDIRPTSLVTQQNFVTLADGVNEFDVTDTELLPGVYWLAVAFDKTVNVGAGVDADPDVTLHFATHSFTAVLPDTFPNSNGNAVNAINLYMVLAP